MKKLLVGSRHSSFIIISFYCCKYHPGSTHHCFCQLTFNHIIHVVPDAWGASPTHNLIHQIKVWNPAVRINEWIKNRIAADYCLLVRKVCLVPGRRFYKKEINKTPQYRLLCVLKQPNVPWPHDLWPRLTRLLTGLLCCTQWHHSDASRVWTRPMFLTCACHL